MARPAGAEAASSRNLKPLARLLPYLARQKKLVGGALVFLALAAVTTLSLPVAVRRVIDHGFSTADTGFIDAYFGMLLILAGILAIASAGRYFFVITLGERIVAELRKDVFAHVARLSPAFFDKSMSGEIVSRLTADATQIKSAVGATASLALRNIILAIGAVAMMAWTSPGLSLIVIAAIPVIVVPLVAFGRSVRRRSRAAQDMLAEASAYANEAIGAVRTVQAFTSEPAVAGRFAEAVDTAFDAARASVTSRALLTGFAIFMIFGSVVAVLWIGAQQVIAGTLTAGTLGQFLLYSVFAAGALGALSEVWSELSAASGAAERLSELLGERPAIASPAHPAQLPVPAVGSVRFEHVSFAYEGAPQRTTVHDLSFEVRPGETVAIVGPSGAGKSTIFSLIERFYDPTAGRILIDGVDSREADLAALRGRIALVPQDVTVFAASAGENIAFGRPGSNEAEIRSAATAALANDFIERLSAGYATRLGERGVTLSGGQRQRIAIARAILRDAPILLLDEATSALDAESEILVQRALEKLMLGRTTIVIAHRLATVLKADRILVLDGGRIVEDGTHASLIARGGLYARLARLQFDSGRTELLGAAE
ncbi:MULTISPECIES: ABC transporter transmembrane domain-containing protein [unclassified Aureimonas]|uniref:ABC transporter transmembrane domain-containing protein n=1 Tax=unclassified Aureimonas TaxID=2615206 RepID=UPI0006F28079|nr:MULTISPECIES: ABC transporter transmembrane domain-containing protein [unclassified Aureimonas]KQT52327.1 ABC transporter [Aureimonas sp. Leaf427]KQT70672.1 ABC transporter [Aureimonas sp. Leaf460]